MSEYINEILATIVTVVVIPLITIIGNAAIKFLKAKVDELTIKKAVESTQAAVAEVNQLYVDDLKKAGAFNEEQKEYAFKKAFELSKQLISENAQAVITKAYKNFDSWLQAQIEAAVRKK